MTQKNPVSPASISWFSLIFIAASMILPSFVLSGLQFLLPRVSSTQLSSYATYSVFLLAIAGYILIGRRRFRDIGFHTCSNSSILQSVLLGLLIQPGAMMISYLSSFMFTDIVSSSIETMLEQDSLFMILICVAFLPALFEETICRGIILFGYQSSLPFWACLLFTSLFFGFLHGNATQFFYASAIGMIFATMDWFSNSVWPSIITHTTFNATQILLAYWQYTRSDLFAEEAESVPFSLSTLTLYLVITLITVPGIIACLSRIKKNRIQQDQVTLSSAELLNPPEQIKTFPPFKTMLPFYAAMALGLFILVLAEIVLAR